MTHSHKIFSQQECYPTLICNEEIIYAIHSGMYCVESHWNAYTNENWINKWKIHNEKSNQMEEEVIEVKRNRAVKNY